MMSTIFVWELLERMQGNIAAEIRVMLGESELPQTLFTPDQRQRRIEAMIKTANEGTDDATRHEAWMKMHVESGWVYGETFDPIAKTHPNLKPWDELPETTRSKAKIFDIVAKAALAIEATLKREEAFCYPEDKGEIAIENKIAALKAGSNVTIEANVEYDLAGEIKSYYETITSRPPMETVKTLRSVAGEIPVIPGARE